MELIRIPHVVHDTCMKHILKGRSVGLVPTMLNSTSFLLTPLLMLIDCALCGWYQACLI